MGARGGSYDPSYGGTIGPGEDPYAAVRAKLAKRASNRRDGVAAKHSIMQQFDRGDDPNAAAYQQDVDGWHPVVGAPQGIDPLQERWDEQKRELAMREQAKPDDDTWQPVIEAPPRGMVAGAKVGKAAGGETPPVDQPKSAGKKPVAGAGGGVGAGIGAAQGKVEEMAVHGEGGELPEHEQKAFDKAKRAMLVGRAKYDLKPLYNLLNTWYGGSLGAGEAPPESGAEKVGRVSGLDMQLAQRKTHAQEQEKQRLASIRAAMAKAEGQQQLERIKHGYRMDEARAKRAGKGAPKPEKLTGPSQFQEVNRVVKGIDWRKHKELYPKETFSESEVAFYLENETLRGLRDGLDEHKAAVDAFSKYLNGGMKKNGDMAKQAASPNEGLDGL